MKNINCGYWKCATRVGLFLGALFAICFVWFYVQPAQGDLHKSLLELSFLGWTGMNATSFILGLAQSIIWGYLFVGVWVLVGCCSGNTCDAGKKKKK